jgi:hypothetical protein
MAGTSPIPPEHPHLRGEAPPGLYGFEDETGARLEGGETIIPLLELIDHQRYQFIGTAFFITSTGVFVTAKHVLMAARDRGHTIATWQLIPPNQWLIRPVDQLSFHDTDDLAVGVARPAAHSETHEMLINPRLPLTMRAHPVGSRVSTYAYPSTVILSTDAGQTLSFQPRFYEGRILEHLPNGRDRVILPGPCYRTSMIIHHGASGGPVAGPCGRVFAVNSTGIQGTDDSYVSQIDGILSLSITVEENNGVEQITVGQLAEQGIVMIDP